MAVLSKFEHFVEDESKFASRSVEFARPIMSPPFFGGRLWLEERPFQYAQRRDVLMEYIVHIEQFFSLDNARVNLVKDLTAIILPLHQVIRFLTDINDTMTRFNQDNSDMELLRTYSKNVEEIVSTCLRDLQIMIDRSQSPNERYQYNMRNREQHYFN